MTLSATINEASNDVVLFTENVTYGAYCMLLTEWRLWSNFVETLIFFFFYFLDMQFEVHQQNFLIEEIFKVQNSEEAAKTRTPTPVFVASKF